MLFEYQTFKESNEVLDGNKYERCNFIKCTLVYRGGEAPMFTSCDFSNCGWSFEDAAMRMIYFLTLLYHGIGDEGKKTVEDLFSTIRQAKP